MRVDIWSDVVCPWCYIGKRRFEKAVERFEHADALVVHWHSFELDPQAPRRREGTLVDLLASKYGMDRAEAEAANARVAGLAAEEGLRFRLDRAQSGNTFDAHRVIHLAAEHGRQGEAKERLLSAYFVEGEAIGDRDTLVRLAGQIGLDAEAVRTALDADDYAAGVRADEQLATELGIQGVPFMVIDGRFGISGAQDPDVIAGVLRQAWAQQVEAAPPPKGGEGGVPAVMTASAPI